jgi:heptosyltransferase-2
MRLGVFLPNWIGDVVMATPTLRAMRQYVGAEGRVVGVMRPYVAEVLAGNSWIDETLCYQKGKTGSAWTVVQQLREARLDAVVLLTNSLRTAWMARRTGVKRRIGYARDGRGWLLTKKLYEPREGGRWSPLPQIDSYLNLAYALGCEWEAPQLELATNAADEKRADDVWRRLGLEDRQVVVLNSGGAFGAAKDWPAEHFADLAKRITQSLGLHVLVNCGPSERETARSIVAAADDPRVVSLADQEQLPIGLTKACIRRAQMLVTTDSGPRFFGIAFNVPTVTLFGPTSTRWTRTHSELETSLSLELDCQPCMARTCPLGHHRCMHDLSVEMVFARVREQLDEHDQRSAAA